MLHHHRPTLVSVRVIGSGFVLKIDSCLVLHLPGLLTGVCRREEAATEEKAPGGQTERGGDQEVTPAPPS